MTQQGRRLRLETIQGGLDRLQVTRVPELVLHLGDDGVSRREGSGEFGDGRWRFRIGSLEVGVRR